MKFPIDTQLGGQYLAYLGNKGRSIIRPDYHGYPKPREDFF